MAIPTGERFSHVYLKDSELLSDSPRMRRRIASAIRSTIDHLTYNAKYDFSSYLQAELGIRYDPLNKMVWGNADAFLNIELRDVLDAITVVFRGIRGRFGGRNPDLFLKEVRRIFAEEQVRYTVDEEGGVHFSVDTEFERMRAATVAVLGSTRFENVRASFDRAFAYLDQTPPDAKSAVRSAFAAAEGLFRLMFQDAHQLSQGEVNKHLKPLVDQLYNSQKPANHFAQKQVASFIDWIDAAHFYRHEPGTEEPAQPPLELAINFLSSAGGYVRWLAQLDKMAQS